MFLKAYLFLDSSLKISGKCLETLNEKSILLQITLHWHPANVSRRKIGNPVSVSLFVGDDGAGGQRSVSVLMAAA